MINHKICVIIPTLNEAENLRLFLPDIKNLYRILVVDNGSTDESIAVAKEHGCEVTSSKTRGYGSVIIEGFHFLKRSSNPRPQVVVVFDGDGTSPWQYIEKLARPIIERRAMLVIGQRKVAEIMAMPFHAKLGNYFAVKFIQFMTGKAYIEMGSMRALSFEALENLDLKDPNWGINVEMQIKCAMRNYSVQEIAVPYFKRQFGRSKISGNFWGSIKAGSKILYSLAYYWWQERFRDEGTT